MKSGKVSVVKHHNNFIRKLKIIRIIRKLNSKKEGSSKPMPRWKPKAFLWGSRSRSKKEEGGFILEPSK